MRWGCGQGPEVGEGGALRKYEDGGAGERGDEGDGEEELREGGEGAGGEGDEARAAAAAVHLPPVARAAARVHRA